MTRKNNASEIPTIVLKTIYDDHMKDNPNSTLDTKKMRAKLRVEMREVHIRNSSWIFTQAQYDTVRAMFDPKYAERVARREKAASRKASKAAKVEEPATTE